MAKFENPLLTDGKLYNYSLAHGYREHEVLKSLRLVTQTHRRARMQSDPIEVGLLQLLVKLINGKRAIEVGVFTGYSTLGTALALPEDGKLIALDISDEFTSIGRPFWEKAGAANKIDLRLGPALDTLDSMLKDEREIGNYDFAYVDADKENYLNYYERLLKLVRKGGVIAIDNVLWSGRVVDENANDPETLAIRSLNEFLISDQRVDIILLPIADGVTILRVR